VYLFGDVSASFCCCCYCSLIDGLNSSVCGFNCCCCSNSFNFSAIELPPILNEFVDWSLTGVKVDALKLKFGLNSNESMLNSVISGESFISCSSSLDCFLDPDSLDLFDIITFSKLSIPLG